MKSKRQNPANVRIECDAWIGTALTSVLFTIGKFLIGLYPGHSTVTSSYRAAGSLITVLLWVYYSTLVFFLGAEFTQVYTSEYGSGVAPAEYAEPLSGGKQEKVRRPNGEPESRKSRGIALKEPPEKPDLSR